MSVNHQVKQGDCISSIACEYGFFPETIWNHPNNARLKEKRQNPNALMPGDIVFVPDLRFKEVRGPTGQVHKFRLKNTPAKLHIQFMFQGQPRANIPYTLTIDGKIVSKSNDATDSSGFVSCSIPPDARQGTLMLLDGESIEEYSLSLGYLNPVTELNGAKQRLQNLGYYKGGIDEELDDETKDAIRDFQKAAGLNQTGELDSVTENKLKQIHDVLY